MDGRLLREAWHLRHLTFKTFHSETGLDKQESKIYLENCIQNSYIGFTRFAQYNVLRKPGTIPEMKNPALVKGY